MNFVTEFSGNLLIKDKLFYPSYSVAAGFTILRNILPGPVSLTCAHIEEQTGINETSNYYVPFE